MSASCSYAAPISSDSVTLLGSNNKVNIIERDNDPNGVTYDLDILDDSLSITAFGVTNRDEPDYYTATNRGSWDSVYISQTEWDSGLDITYKGISVITNELGSFAELYGLDDDAVAFFWANDTDVSREITSTNIGTWGGIDNTFWLAIASKFSQFAAFNGMNVVSQSVQSNVPEPSTLAIFALGIAGLCVRRFKK